MILLGGGAAPTLPGGDIDWPVVPGGDRAQSHGTSVAGIALGRVNGQSGIGVAPESNFMPNGFLENGNLWPSSDYFGMADVINHSWGSSTGLGRLRTAPVFFQTNWQTALDNAIEVKSAGNSRQFWDNTNNSMVSNRKNIIVGATMANGEVEDASNLISQYRMEISKFEEQNNTFNTKIMELESFQINAKEREKHLSEEVNKSQNP